ncbi:MAG: ABC transporter permease [Candidatus Asgardarchaeia archaeon]
MECEDIKTKLRAVWAICWKDIKVYYLKGPVVVMGILFPFFLWFSFYVGRGLETKEGLSSLIAITLFFTASSITPIIAPWETRQKTLEMLLTKPVTIDTILEGDIMASSIFGLMSSIPPIVYGIFIGALPSDIFLFLTAILLSSICFSSIGVMFSALPTDIPADVVLLSSTIKLPLIYVSGVFIPLSQIPEWLLPVSFISPLTYPTEFLRYLYTGMWYIPPHFSLAVTFFITILFTLVSTKLHKLSIKVRFQR